MSDQRHTSFLSGYNVCRGCQYFILIFQDLSAKQTRKNVFSLVKFVKKLSEQESNTDAII
jgi:hypothetical protein